MEFLSEYGLFLAKTITIVVALLVIIGGAFASSKARREHPEKGEIKVTHLNEVYDHMEDTLKYAVLSKEKYKEEAKAHKKEEKHKPKDENRKRVYVVEFEGDVKAHAVENLAQEITTILTMATEKDEVVVKIESPGGQVHGYGLAAAQLSRIKARGIPLTVCVDKVAASGGYMMACIADKILAAPFAIVGSVGVVAELPNFNRLIKKFDVDYDIYTAGEFKRTVTILGENTEEGKKKFTEEIEETHQLFKELVATNRPQLEIEKIATGEHWYGSQAINLKLVDELKTSDDYLFNAAKEAELFQVEFEKKRSMADKLGLALESSLYRVALRLIKEFSAKGKQVI